MDAWRQLTGEDQRFALGANRQRLAMLSGAVVTGAGLWYCAECAPTARVCRQCGASAESRTSLAEESAWADPDRCRACVEFTGEGE